jgi:hypothetical protein
MDGVYEYHDVIVVGGRGVLAVVESASELKFREKRGSLQERVTRNTWKNSREMTEMSRAILATTHCPELVESIQIQPSCWYYNACI